MASGAAEVALTTESLWDWRRHIADLFATIRRMDDHAAAWHLWVDTRADLFAHHPQTPLDPGGEMPVYFDYDPALRFEVELGPATQAAPIYMPAGNDGEVRLTPFAKTSGLMGALGAELTLYWVGGYGGGVFLPFLDATSGSESYGGGRYLLDTIKSADMARRPTEKRCSTSISPTTPRATIPRAGSARCRRAATACRRRCAAARRGVCRGRDSLFGEREAL